MKPRAGSWHWVDLPGCPLDGAVGRSRSPAVQHSIHHKSTAWLDLPLGHGLEIALAVSPEMIKPGGGPDGAAALDNADVAALVMPIMAERAGDGLHLYLDLMSAKHNHEVNVWLSRPDGTCLIRRLSYEPNRQQEA